MWCMRRNCLAVPLLLVALTLNAGAAYAQGTPIVGFEDTGIDVGATNWVRDEDSGEMLPAPPGYVSNDPNQYNAFPQCQVDDGNLAIDCLAKQRVCPPRADGKPGVPVIWKVAPRAVEPIQLGRTGKATVAARRVFTTGIPKTFFPASPLAFRGNSIGFPSPRER
jgi:hypothetical protein